jgi:hypothetical protein
MSRWWVWSVTTVSGLIAGLATLTVLIALRRTYFVDAEGGRAAIPYVAGVLAGLAVYAAFIRILRCPHCGRRFNWRNFGLFQLQLGGDRWDDNMPERRCPRCDNDIYKSPAIPGTIGANRDTK